MHDGFTVTVGNSVVLPTAGSAMQYRPGTMTSSFGNPIAGQLFFDASNELDRPRPV